MGGVVGAVDELDVATRLGSGLHRRVRHLNTIGHLFSFVVHSQEMLRIPGNPTTMAHYRNKAFKHLGKK